MVTEIIVQTGTRAEWVDITVQVNDLIQESEMADGICHLFIPHTTAGLALNENWDNAVTRDIITTLDRLVPWQNSYRHAEGNSAAHIKAALCGSSLSIPVQGGELMLGTWQGIYLAEFDGPRHRRILVTLLGA